MSTSIRSHASTFGATPSVALPSVAFDDDAPAVAAPDAELYALVRRGDIDPRDVEEPGTRTLEVSVLWQSAILHVAHLAEGQAFAIASEGRLGDPTTLIVDESMLPAGVARMTVVADDAGAARFFFVPGAEGDAERADGARESIDALRARGELAPASDALACTMRDGVRYRTRVGALTVMARVVARPRRVAAARVRDTRFLGIGLGALALVGGLVGVMQLTSLSDGAMLSNDDTESRLSDLRDFMAHEAERTPPPSTATSEGAAAPAAASGASGAAGTPSATQPHGANQTAHHLPQPHAGRPMTTGEVAHSGIFDALAHSTVAMGSTGQANPFSTMTPGSGEDARDSTGFDGSGDGLGAWGLGRVGTGIGADGNDDHTTQVGVLGTIGSTCEPGKVCRGGHVGQTIGTHLGPGREHPPTVRASQPEVSNISPEVIRRVVLRNIGQVSHCQEQGLAIDPALAGRVVVRFVVAPGGAVLGSSVAQSSVHIASVNECIAAAVRRWTFAVPSDQGSPVVVNYPFLLSPAQ